MSQIAVQDHSARKNKKPARNLMGMARNDRKNDVNGAQFPAVI
ncbi:hypothetical protein ACFQPF_15505 [Fictibacillus iocasae]|uniref:Uncharacterized protein n=1 Tax=Fictibacillus iocasae TaxID=2715437 RepID=A0ABW2NU16_9BACL